MRLAVHVVCFLVADFTVLATYGKDLFRVIDMNVNLRLALGAREQQRIAKAGQPLTHLAPVDIGAADDAFGAEAKFRIFTRSGHDRQRFVDTKNRQVGCFGDAAVRNVISHSAQQLDETLGASIDDACFAQHIELLSGFFERLTAAPQGDIH